LWVFTGFPRGYSTLNLKLRLGDLRSIVEIVADLGGHVGLLLSSALLAGVGQAALDQIGLAVHLAPVGADVSARDVLLSLHDRASGA
jgi:hypothetical protein